MAEDNLYVGIDVSKAWLDVAVEPAGKNWRTENDRRGINQLVGRLGGLAPKIIVVEATGGYEANLVEHLCEAQLPVARVNPGRVRRFAQGLNWLAKTDRIDARLLARFGEKANPRLTKLPSEHERRLAVLVKRRKQVLEMLVGEHNRLENADGEVSPYIQDMMTMLQKQLDELEQAIGSLIEDTPDLKGKHDVLLTVPGVGQVTASTLTSQLPELGSCDRKQIAALAAARNEADVRSRVAGRPYGVFCTWPLYLRSDLIRSSRSSMIVCSGMARKPRSPLSPVCVNYSPSSMPCSATINPGNRVLLLDIQHSCSFVFSGTNGPAAPVN